MLDHRHTCCSCFIFALPILNQLPSQRQQAYSIQLHSIVHPILQWCTVALRGLHGVAKGVAQIERGAHAALALIRGHHQRLVHARALYRIRQRLHVHI